MTHEPTEGQIVRPPADDVAMTIEGSAARRSFQYPVLECDGFSEVLEGAGRPIDDDELLKHGRAAGAVLLQARGGSGKTYTANRLLEVAAEHGSSTAFATAIHWVAQHPDPEEWPGVRAETVLEAAETLVGSDDEAVLALDGLNEVSSAAATHLLRLVEELVRRHPNLTVVVTDRLSRRDLTPGTWVLATLGPVPTEILRELLASEQVELRIEDAALLSSPYYLRQALESRETRSTRSAAHEGYLREHVGLDEKSIDVLAAAAYDQYRENKSRRLDPDTLAKDIGSEQLRALTEAGALRSPVSDGFSHHLLHDYLAARYVAVRPELWTRDTFDVLTFRASSFDALVMVLEQVDDEATLIRRVHDWNLYAAAYLLAESRVTTPATSEVETALLSMLAERQFDRMLKTAEQVRDALRVHPSDFADRLLKLSSVEEVLALVRDVAAPSREASAWYESWYRLFTRPPGERGDDKLVARIADTDVEGWTASNVLKRTRLSASQVSGLVDALRDDDPTIRWRAAHVLGAHPVKGVIEGLLSSLRDDPDEWVRYGALRSIIEIAAGADEDDAVDIFRGLAREADTLLDRERLLREFERAIVISDPPPHWLDSTGVVIEELWGRASTVEEQDRWRAAGAAVRNLRAAV
ncbi:HEAT repeat domain-containing protein [Blastococcus atacamensis]|uniref:HEAT repeat domain-containing protein n=1 Tax=Blastococcus atacamensis TaxID=2070508 RepID=UPI000CECB494|nr:HEAT repeat domain-containing protein [Blastococcus atacamensis]